MSRQVSQTIVVSTIGGEPAPGVILQITHTYASAADLLDAIGKFLSAWVHTAEGKQAHAEACGDFNWGDFAEWATVLREKIPGVLDIQYAYPAVNGNLSAAIVTHDELLMVAPSRKILAQARMTGPATVVLTAQQFRAQFNTRVEIAPALQARLTVERELYGYRLYRLLDRLALYDPADGQFYIHGWAGEGEREESPS